MKITFGNSVFDDSLSASAVQDILRDRIKCSESVEEFKFNKKADEVLKHICENFKSGNGYPLPTNESLLEDFGLTQSALYGEMD